MNRQLRPVSGWLRTKGWVIGGASRISSSVASSPSFWRDSSQLWMTLMPESLACSEAGNAA